MSKVSVVIPYFQRTPGLLRCALESVFRQTSVPDLAVEVIVVDDESPIPPEPEAAGLERAGFSVRILKRPNGGPARARNTGLDAAQEADFIAFLDSDDWWDPRHLALGLNALSSGAQFHFANNVLDGDKQMFDLLACKDVLLAAGKRSETGALSISGDVAMSLLLKEYLAHTSTVIFDARALGDLRFDEEQRAAGEDYLFWLAAVARSDAVTFVAEPMVTRGRGMGYYESAFGWDNPDCIKRLYGDLLLHKKILSRFCRSAAERSYARVGMELLRREVLYLLMRNARRHWRTNADIVGGLLKHDPGFWANLPYNAMVVMSQKLNGELVFERTKSEF